MNIKQRHFIKSTEIKELKEDITKQYGQEFVNSIFPKKARIEVILTEDGDILYAINNEVKLWHSEKEGYLPVLTQLLENKIKLKTIVVDMGAIRFVTNKADIMRPGITQIDPTIKKGDIVQVVDETHNRALAVGKALYNAENMQKMTEGKVIKNLHTIKKDPVWNFVKEFK
ncbi:MAG: PUA domain-containing protein [Promethearchaeota archaeon]